MSSAGQPEQLPLFDAAESAPREPGLLEACDLPPIPDDLTLFAELQRLSGEAFRSLVLTDNSSRFLSARPAKSDPSQLDLRLHRCFAGAPPEVLGAVVRFAAGRARGAARSKALVTLRRHFEMWRKAAGVEEPPPRRRRITLWPVGETLDLRPVRDELNQRFFGGRLEVYITWGQGRTAGGRAAALSKRRRRRSIRLGSWHEEDNLVRIHPALDRPGVPRYVVEAIVYHELLHADLPAERKNGRRRIHTAEFRRRERLFPRHEEAQRWIRKNLGKLLEA